VGKTHLLSRYIKNELPKNKYPTIGVEFATKGVTLKAGGVDLGHCWPRKVPHNNKCLL